MTPQKNAASKQKRPKPKLDLGDACGFEVSKQPGFSFPTEGGTGVST
jgi:hypothetical protein